MGRREYKMQLIVNGVFCTRVLIDRHYEVKHKNTISDELILELVKTLALRDHKYDQVKESFYYFVNDHIELNEKLYKLVWLMEEHMDYIGVVNAYRR